MGSRRACKVECQVILFLSSTNNGLIRTGFSTPRLTSVKMVAVSAFSSALHLMSCLSMHPYSYPRTTGMPVSSFPCALAETRRGSMPSSSFAVAVLKESVNELVEDAEEVKLRAKEPKESVLYSFTPLLFVSALPGAATLTYLFEPIVEVVRSLNLPAWLVHWGHPGNMAVVLFAMGGYGTFLGFRIRYSNNVEEKAMAKDLHPKLLGGMFFFFALGATGGIISLLTSGKPIFESPHALTGIIGLSLLTIQTSLPALFEGKPGLRNVHGVLGSGIMTLFLIHAALGLQLGLTY